MAVPPLCLMKFELNILVFVINSPLNLMALHKQEFAHAFTFKMVYTQLLAVSIWYCMGIMKPAENKAKKKVGVCTQQANIFTWGYYSYYRGNVKWCSTGLPIDIALV